MKIFFCWLGFLASAHVLQTSLLPFIGFRGVSPDLLLLLVVSFSFLRGSRLGVFMGFFAGLLQDLSMGTFFGINIFTKMLVGYICGAFSNRVFKEQVFLPIMASAIATTMSYFILALIMVLLGYRFNLMLHLQSVLLPMLWYNVLFAYPMHRWVYMLCEYLKEKK